MAKEDPTVEEVEVMSLDFEQSMPLPHVPFGDVFYKRQLSFYPFCINKGSVSNSYFYVFDEITGRKSPNEVIICLQDFINYIYPENSNIKNSSFAKFTTSKYKVVEYSDEHKETVTCLESANGLVTEDFVLLNKSCVPNILEVQNKVYNNAPLPLKKDKLLNVMELARQYVGDAETNNLYIQRHKNARHLKQKMKINNIRRILPGFWIFIFHLFFLMI
ncbi:unnamed protein product [Psylliodes chrysocephalus]|uniref:Uncharacterized protein n=1 Tax=Psylliodes chrysocephalus TaxID=3402493 RepID=A0A9P0G2C5_9CUCU|nr:unnamed protein product [Psylliodes chrysocephala]